MQNPNLPAAPRGQPVPQGAVPPGQGQPMSKEQKRAEAEKQKRLQQEKLRASELMHQIGAFTKTLSTAVIDTPMMYKLGCNTYKTMMRADHCIAGIFKEFPETGIICVVNAEAIGVKEIKKPAPPPLPKGQPPPPPPPEPDLTKPPPKPLLPQNPPKPGTILPTIDFWLEIPVIMKMRELKQPVMIPDASKFSEPELAKFATAFGIKSLLAVPVTIKNSVHGVIIVYTINAFQAFAPVEITHLQKGVSILAKSVETAPPNLPDEMKKKVITKITKAEDSKKVIAYYTSMLDDVFDFIIGEMEEIEAKTAELEESTPSTEEAKQEEQGVINSEETPKPVEKKITDSELLKLFMEDRKKEESLMRKVWFQLAKFLEFDGDKALLSKIALEENFAQAEEDATEKDIYPPPGFKLLIKYLNSTKKTIGLEQYAIPAETITSINEEIDKAVRGQLIHKSDDPKATLINDVEQSDMLANFVSIPAAMDFRQHVKAAAEETDIPEEIDILVLLDDLCYAGMKEIVKSVGQAIAEKNLFELPNFLEQPEAVQLTQTESLTTHIQRRVMANLVGVLKGKSTDWTKGIVDKLKQKSKEAAKKRAVLVGKITVEQEEEEE